MEDIIRAILRINEEIKEIRLQLEALKKRPDVLFKEDWMDNLEVCNALHISNKSLRYLRRSGKLPFTRLQKKILYKVADVKSLLNDRNFVYHYSPKP